MQQSQFLGIHSLIDTNEQSYKEQIESLEHSVIGIECTDAIVLDFLSNTYHLGLLYRQTEQDPKIERLIALINGNKPSFPVFEKEFNVTLNLLKEMLAVKQGRLKYRRRYLQEAIDYAILADNPHLLAIALNKLGYYYHSLFQNDVACVYYLLAINVCYIHHSDYSQEQYNALILHPVMNLITTMGERKRNMSLKARLFNSSVLDNQSRLLLGGILENYIEDSKATEPISFNQKTLENLRTKLYGSPDWRTIHGKIERLALLGKSDAKYREELLRYYEQESAQWDDNEKLLALFRLRDERQSDFVIAHLTPDLYFKHSAWIHQYWDDFTIDAQDHILELMIYDVRQLKAQLSYVPAQTLFDAIQRGRALYTPERLGHIMLKHCGTNLVYERAYGVVTSVAKYCGLPKGKEWIHEAVGFMGFEQKEETEGLISAIENSLEKHCTFYPHYSALVENMFLLRSMISGREQFKLYQTIIRRTHNATRRDLLFKEFSHLKPSQSGSRKEKETDWEALYQDYDQGENPDADGFAIKIFKLLDYSSLNHQETKADLTIEQTASLEAAERQLNIDYSGFRDSDEYVSCVKALKKAEWDINDKDINRNFLLLERNGVVAILYFMFEAEYDWYADESPFNSGSPRWFSLTTSIVSPVYRLKNYSLANNGNCRRFVLLVPPTYVINADALQAAWQGVMVYKLKTFLKYLEESGNLPDTNDLIDLCKDELLGAQLPSLPVDDEAARQNVISRILNNRENVIRQFKEASASPWNFSRIYLDYRYNPYLGLGDTSVDETQYDLGNSAFMHVLNKLGMSHLAQMGSNDVHIIIYLRRTSVKFNMWAHVNDDYLAVESFRIENYRSDELKYIDGNNSDPRIGFVDRGGVFFLGNIAEEECAIIYHIKPDSNSTFARLDVPQKDEVRQSIRRKFCDALIAVGSEDQWKDSLSTLSGLILHDEVKVLAEKTAQTAIMARNMSHNLGSHVMAYLKRDLSSTREIFRKGLLRDFYPFTDLGQCDMGDAEQFLSYFEHREQNIELPFLLGLGKFISYLQERQDFIATVATNYIPYFSEINFCDDVYDTINLDYRNLRNGGACQENILLKYIALSEGLTRTSNLHPEGGNIVIKFRNYDGINDFRDQNNRSHGMKAKGPGKKDLDRMRQYSFHMPGGIVGRQALFSIMENLIRNAAKHGNWRSGQKNLEFTFDVYSGRTLSTDERSADLFGYLKERPEWIGVLTDPAKPLDKYHILTITDNLPIRDVDFQSISNAITEDYVDENSVFIDHHKGIKEIRISAAWLRGIANDLHRPIGEPPVVTIRKDNGNLQYIICVFAPRKVVIIADTPEEYDSLVAATKSWEGWFVTGSKDYMQSNYKTATVIALRNKESVDILIPVSPDRVTILEDRLYQSIISGEYSEEDALRELVFKMYQVDDQDGPILISDGKARASESQHIKVVSSDIEADGVFHYAYRTHHSNPDEFKNYMEGALRKDMLSVEGVSGNNSTDRLIRGERLNDIWYCKHLNALRTKVAIFDERLFSKITGLSDEQLLGLAENSSAEASIDTLVNQQKRLWVFTIIARPDRDDVCFDIFGLIDNEDSSGCHVGKVASIRPSSFDCKYGALPHISIQIQDSYYEHFFDYISIHQGILDKIYDGINVKNIPANSNSPKDVIAIAKYGITANFNNSFQVGGSPVLSEEDALRFHRGFFIHSGRSKPSIFDMPQRVPFIQFSAIENATFDCKYSLVELMKSAYYESE